MTLEDGGQEPFDLRALEKLEYVKVKWPKAYPCRRFPLSTVPQVHRYFEHLSTTFQFSVRNRYIELNDQSNLDFLAQLSLSEPHLDQLIEEYQTPFYLEYVYCNVRIL